VDKETPSELLREAAPVIVPPEELRSSALEDEELAMLGHLTINIGETLELGLAEVWRRWFLTSDNAVTALESWEVIERGGKLSCHR
jgi:hypothetical protein